MKVFTVVCLALCPAFAQAADFTGTAGASLWKSGPDSEGFGAHGSLRMGMYLAEGLALKGRRLRRNIEEVRLGGGLISAVAPTLQAYALAEVLRIDWDGRPGKTGVGLQGGLLWKAAPALMLESRIGAIDVGDYEGSEFLLRGQWQFNAPLSVSLERRESVMSQLSGADTRVMAQYHFGFRAQPVRHRR